MAYPVKFKSTKQLEYKKIRVDKIRGLDMSKNHTQIEINQSPDMSNCDLDTQYSLNKRKGWKTIKAFGSGKINGIFQLGLKNLVVVADEIYDFTDEGVTNLLHTGVDARHRAFEFNSKLYIQNGSEYLVYDGATITDVVGYVPTISIGTPPSGGGTDFEQLNLIQPRFKQSFNGDGSTTLFQLAFSNLGVDAVTAEVDGVAKVEGVDFTVNRTNGTVSFSTAPSLNVDNAIIEATKDFGEANKIFNCTINSIFSGGQDAKVFISGNPNFPNYDWSSGALDPTYFPNLGFDIVGFDDQSIVGYEKQFTSQLIYKYNSLTKKKSMYVRNITSVDPVVFTTVPINDQRGAFSQEVISLINGTPVSIDDLGGFWFTGGQVKDERNVEDLTERINFNRNATQYPALGILETTEDLVTIDYDRKLWISDYTQSKVYIYNYQIDEFYPYNNIKAYTMAQIGSRLYFGDDSGNLMRIRDNDDLNLYKDDSTPVSAYYRSKAIDDSTPEIQDQLNAMFVTILPYAYTSCLVRTRTSRSSAWEDKREIKISLFSYPLVDYSMFTYGANSFPQTPKINVKAKKINYFQYELSNSNAEPLTIPSVVLKLLPEREVKR